MSSLMPPEKRKLSSSGSPATMRPPVRAWRMLSRPSRSAVPGATISSALTSRGSWRLSSSRASSSPARCAIDAESTRRLRAARVSLATVDAVSEVPSAPEVAAAAEVAAATAPVLAADVAAVAEVAHVAAVAEVAAVARHPVAEARTIGHAGPEERAAEQRPEQDARQQAAAEAPVVAARPRPEARRLPVGHAAAARHDLARDRLAALLDADRVRRARRDGPRLPAGRRPWNVADGRAVAGVEEAGRPALGRRAVREVRLGDLHVEAALLERLGDRLEVLRAPRAVQGGLGLLVARQRDAERL